MLNSNSSSLDNSTIEPQKTIDIPSAPIMPNPLLAAGLSLTQAKTIGMEEGKKIKHKYFTDAEFLYYKDGRWFTEENYQVPNSYWLNAQNFGWNDGWSIL
jgi:hypothetical protein